MEQNEISRCHKCGKAADHMFAFLRLGDKDAVLGAVSRSVCGACLEPYIERVQSGKHDRFAFLVPLLACGALGGLLCASAKTSFWQGVGVLAIVLGVVVAGIAIYQQMAETKRARVSTHEENVKRYSAMMCKEAAAKAGGKLVELKIEYAADEYSIERIAKEAGVSMQVAALIKMAALEAVIKAAADQKLNG